jgi:hypothetical protein
LTKHWRSYSRPRQDRWHRNEEDLQEVEAPRGSVRLGAGYTGDGSSLFPYNIDVNARARTMTHPEAGYEALDGRCAKIFQELRVSLPKLS